MALVLVLILLSLMGAGNWSPPAAPQAVDLHPSPTVTANLLLLAPPGTQPPPTSTPVIETLTPTQTLPPTPVPLTLEITLPPTESPTVTLTIEPTPVYARIRATKGGGAILREVPGGKGLTVLDNFSIVELLPETQELSGYTWSHVIAIQNGIRLEGWILQIVLDVATPPPNWQPSATPSFTPTP
jgi:hypothetical protein